MSGHSKWSTIKRQKESADKKRGQAFTKIGRSITLVAKSGTDPETNFKLRMIIEKAKAVNMPKANIERILEKVRKGGEGAGLTEILLEGFASDKVAILVEATTDNPNRTISELRSLFSKNGASLGERGSVSHFFSQAGLIFVAKDGRAIEAAMLDLMDIGEVEDIEEVEGGFEVYTKVEALHAVKVAIEAKNYQVREAEIIWKPIILVEVKDRERALRILDFLETLEECDDVQKVYSNLDIADEILNHADFGN